MSYYYVETDGEVFLVKRKGIFTFPRSREELPFEVKKLREIRVEDQPIYYCLPRLENHPTDWINKERIPLLDEVDKIVRKAVNFTLPRVVVEAVVRRGKGENSEVLLVKPKRGYNRDQWTLPGGFLLYGESPEEGLAREVREEIGCSPRSENLLTVYSHIGAHNSYQWLIFYYSSQLEDDSSPEPNGEISELGWFPPELVVESLGSPLMAEGFKEILREGLL